jgi:hypothetical protein
MHSRWPNRLTCDPLGRADTSARHICCRLSALPSFADILMHGSEPPLRANNRHTQCSKTSLFDNLFGDGQKVLALTILSGLAGARDLHLSLISSQFRLETRLPR